MTRLEHIRETAKLIVALNNGATLFSYKQASAILGCSINHIGHRLHEAGVLVMTHGKTKYITAIALAEYMHYNQIAPIDNRYHATKPQLITKVPGKGAVAT